MTTTKTSGAVEIRRPALRWYGGKWRLAPWIIGLLPPHETYVEPYAGGASILIRKEPAPIEIINDLDDEVVNFFRVLREEYGEMVRLLHYTPYARAEFDKAFIVSEDPLTKAVRFYIRSWMAYGGARQQWKTGWRVGVRGRGEKNGKPISVVHTWNDVKSLEPIAMRLKNAFIEQMPALDLIRKYDGSNVLFYVDPPYPAFTRNERWSRKSYMHEMEIEDHRELAALLHNIQGMAVVSSSDSLLYDELYAGWTKHSKDAVAGMGEQHKKKAYKEVLYLSPLTRVHRQYHKNKQTLMFEDDL